MKKIVIAFVIISSAVSLFGAPRFNAKTWGMLKKYDVRALSRNFDSHVGELVEIQFNFRGKDIHHVKPGWYEASIWQPDPDSRKHFADVRVMVSKKDLKTFKAITEDASSQETMTVYGKVSRESEAHWVFVQLYGRNVTTDSSGTVTVNW